jgi:hypothetical protein
MGIMEKCSADTALRDITDLLQRRLLRKNEGGGRSTSYSLAEETAEGARRSATCGWPQIAPKFGARGASSPMIANRYQKKRTRRS